MKRSNHSLPLFQAAGSLLITSVLATITVFSTQAADIAAPEPDSSSSESAPLPESVTNTGDPGVYLQRLDDGSVTIQARPEISARLRMNDLFFTSDTRVIKIGDSLTKGRTIEELTQLLQGPINSEVRVTLIIGGHATVKSLVRLSAKQLNGKPERINSMYTGHNTDLYTNWNGSNRDVSAARGRTFSAEGNIVCATPAYVTATEALPFHFAAFYDDNLRGLGDALDYYARTGMFARFDAAIKLALNASSGNVGKYTDSDCASLIKCADSLRRSGNAGDARTIYDRLYASRQSFSAENNVNLLLGKAKLAAQQDNVSSALTSYKELTEICLSSAGINPEVQNSALSEVVAYAVSHKESELAVKAQRRFNECAGSSPGFRVLPAAIEQLRLQALLADAYALADHTKAIETLQQALVTYDENSTRDDAVLADRVFTVCPASIRFKLAYLCLLEGRRDEAKKYFKSGAKYWSEDVGSDTKNAAEIKSAELALATESDQNNADLLAAVVKLPGVTATPTPQISPATSPDKEEKLKLARTIYDAAIAVKAAKTVQLLDSLIIQESVNPHHDSLDVARLVNLVTASGKAIGKQKVDTYLERLSNFFSQSDSLREPAALYIRTEQTVLRDPKTEQAQWGSFDTYLTDIAEASGSAANQLDDPHNRVQRLLEISYSYAIRKEPDKALKFVEFIHLKYPAVAHDALDVVAYETTLKSLLGNKLEAEKSLNTLIALRKNRGGDPRMLATVAATFANISDRTDSLRVLTSTSNAPQDVHTNRQLAYYRALVHYKFGNYKDAIAELSDPQPPMLPGQQINEYRRLKAELFARTGEPYKAVQALCETAGDGMIEKLALERALEILKTAKGVSQESIDKLVDFSNRIRLGFGGLTSNSQLALALKQLLTIAKERQCAPAKISALQQRLGIDTISDGANGAHSNGSKIANKPATSYSIAANARQLIVAHNYQEGYRMFLSALQAEDGANFNNGMYHYGNLKGDLCVQVLTDAKEFDILEKILEQALKTRLSADEKVEQSQKTLAQIEKTLLSELFLEQGKYDEAKKWADETVKAFKERNDWCTNRGSAQNSSAHEYCISLVRQFIARKQFETARNMLNQLDEILASRVGSRHVLWIEDKLARAQLFEAEGKLPEAENLAKDALDLDTWTNGARPTAHRTRSTYASILREEGKNTAADAAEVIEAQEFKYDGQEVYGNMFRSPHSPPPVVFVDTAEGPLKKFFDNHIIEHGEGSSETQAAMDDLTRFYVQQKRWDEAEKVQLSELRTLDQMFGPCLPAKQSCFLNLAEIYKGKNEKRLAVKYANQIQTINTSGFRDGSENVSKLRLANVLLFIGKKDEGLEMAKAVEAALFQRKMSWWNVNEFSLFDDCITFMRSAGANSDADALEAEKAKRFGSQRIADKRRPKTPTPTAEERRRNSLDKATKEISETEASKEKEPEKYFFALISMFSASLDRSAPRGQDAEPQEAEKYFLCALEFFEKHDSALNTRDRYSSELQTLWSQTRQLSGKTFAAVFDRLCKCSDRVAEREYLRTDRNLAEALESRTRELRGTEKKQFLQRAIDIRKADCGPSSKRLGSLYLQMATCCEQLGDSNAAEKYRLDSLSFDYDASERVNKWLDMARFYGRIHEADKEEAAWRKALEISNKNKLEFDPRSWINLIDELTREGHSAPVDEITNCLLANPSLNSLNELDKYLNGRLDAMIKSGEFANAAKLVKKRLAVPAAQTSKGQDTTDWQVRLSNLYLAEGNEKESQVLFNRILASLALLGRPTDELRRDRAMLLERLGKHNEAQILNAGLPNSTGAVIISSPMMAKELIRFGHNSLIGSFDSTESNSSSGRAGKPMLPARLPGMPGDPTTIICEGSVTNESNNVLFSGKIACKKSDLDDNVRLTIVSVPAGVTINDALPPPASAERSTPKLPSTGGDYIVTDFERRPLILTQSPARPLRLFLQDSSGKSEIECPYVVSNQITYRQLQVWYNGTKPIKVHAFSGLLYAPHAVVKMEFNGRFRGVLVARQIFLEGNNNIELDRSAVDKNLSQ